MNPVLIYFNPKNLPRVIEEFNKIDNIDKILFSYFGYPEVIAKAKAWLITHKKYTHVMIASNDVVVTKKNIQRMLDVSKSFDVISGVMNVDFNDFRFFNVCLEIPIKNIDYKEYKWIKKEKLGIIKVQHSGFALMCVRREIILKDGFWGTETQIPMDMNFSWHCYYSNIDIFCDTQNIMTHLRHQGEFKKLTPIIKECIHGK